MEKKNTLPLRPDHPLFKAYREYVVRCESKGTPPMSFDSYRKATKANAEAAHTATE
jgi:hypothetical protein